MSRRLPVTFLLLLLAPLHARAATVRTMDGAFHDGEVRFEKDCVVVQPATGTPVTIDLSNVLAADLRAPAPTSRPNATPRWTARDVGTVAAPGTVRFHNNVITVRASGTGLGGSADGGQFVVQSVAGDAEIVARVTSLQQSHPLARAAIVFRASMDPAAPTVALAFQAAGNSTFQQRLKPGAHTVVREGGATQLPLYLKLTRRGNTFSALLSADGETWSSVGSQEVSFPSTAFVGLAVSANTEHAVTTAVFDNVAVTRTLSLRSDDNASASSRGLVLKNGTVLTGQIRNINGTAVTLSRPREPNMIIPLREVSRVFFAPLTADVLSRLPQEREGVLLANGDFVEGQVLDVSESRAKVSSVLFGIKRFETRQVAVVAYRTPVAPAATRYYLRAADGSSIFFDEAQLTSNVLHIKDPVLSPLLFPLSEVAELDAGPRRVRALTSMKPSKVSPEGDDAGYAVNASLTGGPIALTDRAVTDGISIGEGVRIEYALDGRFRLLSLQLAVPREVPVSRRVVFSVIVDGKEAYRSSAITHGEAPMLAKADLVGAKSLVIRVASEGEGARGVGVLIDPVLVLAERG
jgi:hypothetical protein